ncbi:helix-turn-helix domain-containing protein [Flavobacterium yafengii]|uniref:helix-turn-helix domain-containing protein n=1 Tax=Flavobacterium yafengii TaxID=3041253 RepID=UPI0024A803E1|nr:AraC family transcriptional regulator [Flavobacterium yafengii]MDI5897061.1 AraC family transcriptional regulator [Flavobacterium yafengii]MDI6046268.1 AraC family transcriptional regulator [Flavobacterium yafengii]
MNKVVKFNTISEYNVFNNNETLHPLISVIDFSKASQRSWEGEKSVIIYYGFYCIFLKDIKCGDLRYGCDYYDYQEGTLVFIAPGQRMEVEPVGKVYQPKGYALVFHPDLIHGTSLFKSLNDYNFFSYNANEALHLSERERQIVLDSFSKINLELQLGVDKHSKKLIASNIELFLGYCERFYDRQFITRESVNKGILERFEEVLSSYFTSDKPNTIGLPSVAYCANELHLSANYFGDLIKKETGKSAQEYIQNKIIDIAKNKISGNNLTVNEIAYELGFKYPQHFSRLFKQRVGYTPNQYRSLN